MIALVESVQQSEEVGRRGYRSGIMIGQVLATTAGGKGLKDKT